MTIQTIDARVTDANRLQRGVMRIAAEMGDHGPTQVRHDGNVYWFTGKTGVNVATGQSVLELATDQDARLWINKTGAEIWED